MKTIKLMADYFCYPLWRVDSDEFGDISPDSLPISASLREALMTWAAEYDATLDMDDPHLTGFNTQADADSFKATGFALAERLRNELGPECSVLTYIVANPKPSVRGRDSSA